MEDAEFCHLERGLHNIDTQKKPNPSWKKWGLLACLDHYDNSKTTQIKLAFGGMKFLISFKHIFLVIGKTV